jgi:hypothetical protein
MDTNRTNEAAAVEEKVLTPTELYMNENVSHDAAAVIENYTDRQFNEMNGILRGKTYSDALTQSTQKSIDTMKAVIDNAPPHPELTVYRAFRSQELRNQAEQLVGQTVTEKGFMSTTASTTFVNRWASGRLYDDALIGVRLRVPPGVPALYVPSNAYGSKEYEFILPPGTGMNVTKVTQFKEGGILIDADAVRTK